MLAVDLRDFGHEIEGVNGFVWMREEISDVKHATLVLHVKFLAVENNPPDTAIFADGVAWTGRGLCDGCLCWFLREWGEYLL